MIFIHKRQIQHSYESHSVQHVTAYQQIDQLPIGKLNRYLCM